MNRVLMVYKCWPCDIQVLVLADATDTKLICNKCGRWMTYEGTTIKHLHEQGTHGGDMALRSDA